MTPASQKTMDDSYRRKFWIYSGQEGTLSWHDDRRLNADIRIAEIHVSDVPTVEVGTNKPPRRLFTV
jgi:hypothetical protein